MAHISAIRHHNNLRIYHNVNAAVGPYHTNYPADVALVQYLLETAFTHAEVLEITRPPGPQVIPTGQFDKATAVAIRHFQEQVKARGKKVGTDGIVDWCPGNKPVTPRGNTYTIIHLNFAYRRARPSEYDNIITAADIPQLVADALMA